MKKSILLFVTLSALALTACQKPGGTSEKPVEKLVGDVSLYSRGQYSSTYYGLRTLGEGRTNETFTRVSDEEGTYFSQRDVKALVVPVDFTEYPATQTLKGEDGLKEDLRKAIFGTSEEVYWESLSSYYRKTSFGQCNITGAVTNTYHVGKRADSFGKKETSATKQFALAIQKWVEDGNAGEGINLKDFDANHDGFVDSLIMIYTAPMHMRGNDDDLFWAFQWQQGTGPGTAEKPNIDHFFWASYKFFYEDGYYDANGGYHDWTDQQIASGEARLDAHTLIHEFGHILSMPDYYNGDYGSSSPYAYEPLLGADMMAHNIGDHNSFSKALYGWTSPYVVEGNAEVTIESTSRTGEFIILPIKSYLDENGFYTLLDQYLVIEYITPEGVGKMDSEDRFAGSYPLWFSKAGIRVLLVDARPGMFATNGGSFQGFTSSVMRSSGYYVSFACDNNSVDSSCYPSYKLIEIVAKGNIPTKNISGNATDDMLYQKGDWFGANGSWDNYKVHNTNGSWDIPLGFKFQVTDMNETSARLKFEVL